MNLVEPITGDEQESDTLVTDESDPDWSRDEAATVGGEPIGDQRGVVAPNRVIGGVAAELASRLGVDPLWVRIVFVALIAFGGLGFVAYAGLWLVLVGGSRAGWESMRYAGAAVLAVGLFVLFSEGNFLLGNPAVSVALLAGVAIALWQPRGVPARLEPYGATGDPNRPARPAPSLPRLPRERSLLGRWVLALALFVAAGGGLVDQLNQGRLHPEQWLGAAAAVCGLGVVIAALRGSAYWLAVPALALGSAGFVAGHGARAALSGDLNFGGIDYWLNADYDDLPPSDSVVAGNMRVHVAGAPTEQNRSDLHMGIGVIFVNVAWGVSAEVRATLYDGAASVDGVLTPSPDGVPVVMHVGPEGEPDVIINAVVSRGNVRVTTGPDYHWDDPPSGAVTPTSGVVPTVAPPVTDGSTFDIGEGFRMLSDGTVLFPADGQFAITSALASTLITPGGQLSTVLPTTDRPGGTTSISVDDGGGFAVEYLLLPNGMVLTPDGAIVDIPAARKRVLANGEPADQTATTDAGEQNAPATITTIPSETTEP